MRSDLLTVIWKEWTELGCRYGASRRTTILWLSLPIAYFGIIHPWRAGPAWTSSALEHIATAWAAMFLVAEFVADSFAGERERHTLETLLASRLPDRAILLGKVAAIVGVGIGVSLSMSLIGLVTVNLVHGHGRLLMLTPAMGFLVLLGFLQIALAALAGIFFSLRSSTVRQARQTLGYALMIVLFGFVLGIKALPAESRQPILKALATGQNIFEAEIIAALILIALDAALVVGAIARFRRARLILD